MSEGKSSETEESDTEMSMQVGEPRLRSAEPRKQAFLPTYELRTCHRGYSSQASGCERSLAGNPLSSSDSRSPLKEPATCDHVWSHLTDTFELRQVALLESTAARAVYFGYACCRQL